MLHHIATNTATGQGWQGCSETVQPSLTVTCYIIDLESYLIPRVDGRKREGCARKPVF